MHIVKLQKVDNAIHVALPQSVVENLHWQENAEVIIEVVDDRIILSPATSDFLEAWEAYQQLEPRYHEANQKLVE